MRRLWRLIRLTRRVHFPRAVDSGRRGEMDLIAANEPRGGAGRQKGEHEARSRLRLFTSKYIAFTSRRRDARPVRVRTNARASPRIDYFHFDIYDNVVVRLIKNRFSNARGGERAARNFS